MWIFWDDVQLWRFHLHPCNTQSWSSARLLQFAKILPITLQKTHFITRESSLETFLNVIQNHALFALLGFQGEIDWLCCHHAISEEENVIFVLCIYISADETTLGTGMVYEIGMFVLAELKKRKYKPCCCKPRFPAIQGKDGKHTVAFILLMRECLICSWHRWGHKLQHCALIHNKPAKVREWELQAFLQLGCVCLDNITLHDIRLPLAFTALYAGSEIHVENYEDLANVERKAHGDWLIGAQGLAEVWHRSEAIAFAPIGLTWLFWRLHMTYVRTFEENAMQQQLKQMFKIVGGKKPLCPILNRLQPKLIFDSEQKVILSAKGSVSLALINLVETVWRIRMHSDSELESPNYFHHFSSSYFTLSTSLKLLDANWRGNGNHVKDLRTYSACEMHWRMSVN